MQKAQSLRMRVLNNGGISAMENSLLDKKGHREIAAARFL
jgi:hypothetical protein